MSAQKIYSLIDDILNDIDNAPTYNTKSKVRFSTNIQQQQQTNTNTNQPQQGRKKKKKKIKSKKNKKKGDNENDNTQPVKASKRAAKLTTIKELPDPTFKNGIKC